MSGPRPRHTPRRSWRTRPRARWSSARSTSPTTSTLRRSPQCCAPTESSTWSPTASSDATSYAWGCSLPSTPRTSRSSSRASSTSSTSSADQIRLPIRQIVQSDRGTGTYQRHERPTGREQQGPACSVSECRRGAETRSRPGAFDPPTVAEQHDTTRPDGLGVHRDIAVDVDVRAVRGYLADLHEHVGHGDGIATDREEPSAVNGANVAGELGVPDKSHWGGTHSGSHGRGQLCADKPRVACRPGEPHVAHAVPLDGGTHLGKV